MKPNSKIPSQNNYTQLLIVLVASFLVAPFVHNKYVALFLLAIYLPVFFIGLKKYCSQLCQLCQLCQLSQLSQLSQPFILCTVFMFILYAIVGFGWYDSEVKLFSFSFFLQTGYAIVFCLIIGATVFGILRDIFSCQRVTADTIIGSICVYLLIGYMWVMPYAILDSYNYHCYNNQAFSKPLIQSEYLGQAIYFSFTTLTSLGYGDILPVSSLAKMLTNLEAVVGQMYPAILIAILVSGYVSSKQK